MRRLLIIALNFSTIVVVSLAQDQPAFISTEQFRHLRWLVGSWREYLPDLSKYTYWHFAYQDDSTLVMEQYLDSALTQKADETHITLRNNRVSFISGETIWTAVSLDSAGITFENARARGSGLDCQTLLKSKDPRKWSHLRTWVDKTGETRRSLLYLTAIQ